MKYSHKVLDQALNPTRARSESDVSKPMSAAPSFTPGEKAQRDGPQLDRVLNNLAARAMEDTSASTVAIGVEREGLMICRAVAGLPLADTGTPINTESGLTGMAVRLQMSQWCTDTESDRRVDLEVCRQLGLSSIIVVPMRSGDVVIGIFAIFSATPDAFSLDDLKTVKKLAHYATEASEASAVKLAGPTLAGLDYSEEKQPIGVDWPGGTESYLAKLRRTMAWALNPLRNVFRHRSVPPSAPSRDRRGD